MSLFGGGSSQARSRNLLEFKAGKMNLRGTMVHPDKRKGLVYLHQGDDMLMHFCWKDRSSSSSTPEDDLVIFPEEIEFKKVTQNSTGRIYLLKWRSNARKLFFWMQEPKDDKDDEFCKKVNNLLNHPPTPGFADESTGNDAAHALQPLMNRMAAGGAGGIDPSDLSNVLRGMNPGEFASLLSSFGGGSGAAADLMQDAFAQSTGGSRPNTAPASVRAPGSTSSRTGGSSSKPRNGATSSSSTVVPPSAMSSAASGASRAGQIQMNALTSILANMSDSTAQETAADPSQAANHPLAPHTIEHLIPLLIHEDVQQKLRAHLPAETILSSTEQELRASLQSPQPLQTISALRTVVEARELGPVLARSNFPEEVIQAANHGDWQALLQALEKRSRNESETKNPTDATMDLD